MTFAWRARRCVEDIHTHPALPRSARIGSPNPNTTTILRAGDLHDRTSFFEYDRWRQANPDGPRNSHTYLLQFPVALVPVARSAQGQIADFFASDGKTLTRPRELGEYWQVPMRQPLPEGLGYIR